MHSQHVHIIAEAGSNHNGELELAKALVTEASRAGADSVKFQFIYPDHLYIPAYWSGESLTRNPVHTQRLKEQLSDDEWFEVFACAGALGIECSASLFDPHGLELLTRLDVPYVKVASTDLDNTPLLTRVAASGIPVILSTGMSTLSEIEDAVDIFRVQNALNHLTLLHCVSVYPCALADARVYMIEVLRSAFGVRIGFSDHTEGTEAAVMAVALGAEVIEKHFTTNKSLPGFDHAHAFDVDELHRYVDCIRAASTACARNSSKVADAERLTSLRARRGLYAARDLSPGDVIREEDVLIVRPSAELRPNQLHSVVGRHVHTAIRRFESIGLDPVAGPGRSSWQEADGYWRREMIEKGMSRSAD